MRISLPLLSTAVGLGLTAAVLGPVPPRRPPLPRRRPRAPTSATSPPPVRAKTPPPTGRSSRRSSSPSPRSAPRTRPRRPPSPSTTAPPTRPASARRYPAHADLEQLGLQRTARGEKLGRGLRVLRGQRLAWLVRLHGRTRQRLHLPRLPAEPAVRFDPRDRPRDRARARSARPLLRPVQRADVGRRPRPVLHQRLPERQRARPGQPAVGVRLQAPLLDKALQKTSQR